MANIRRAAKIINPGPLNRSVLHLQEKHRSQNVWIGEPLQELKIKCAAGSTLENIDPRIYAKLVECGFEGVLKLGSMKIEHKLINALVERWRPKTFTFHFGVGETTITLQDVEVLTGLRVDGEVVTGATTSAIHLTATCQYLLGRIPNRQNIKGNLIKLKWLRDNFSILPENADDVTVDQHTRAFILILFGGLLFSNVGGNGVNVMWLQLLEHLTANGCGSYAWGAAVLSNLYRELTKATNPEKDQICGYLQLLQLWAYERLTIISPTRSH